MLFIFIYMNANFVSTADACFVKVKMHNETHFGHFVRRRLRRLDSTVDAYALGVAILASRC